MKQATSDSFMVEINDQESYQTVLNAIAPVPGQSLMIFFKTLSFIIQLDSGATVSFIRMETAKRIGCHIGPNGQLALLADKKTRMQSLGEIDILVTTDKYVLRLRALVVTDLQVEAYAGTTFNVANGIEADISSGLISLHKGLAVVQQYNPMIGGKPIPHPPPFLTTKGCGKQINSASIYQDSNQKAYPTPSLETANFASINESSPTIQRLSVQIEQLTTEVSSIKTSLTSSGEATGNYTSKQNIIPSKSSTIHIMTRKTIIPNESYAIKLNAVDCDKKKVALIPQFSRYEDQGPDWEAQICNVYAQGCAAY